MELAATLMTSLASTFSTVAPAAATTATTAATATASAGSSLWSILQGTATALSVVGGLRSAQAQADARNAQAEDAKLEAAMEGTRGIERMVEDLGARDVAYAASNVDLSFGTPAKAREGAVADANAALSTDAETETIRRNRLLSRAAQYRMMADDASAAGTLKAITGGMSMLADVSRRR